MKNEVQKVTIFNLLADGIDLIGVAFSLSVSFVLTVLCCVTDYKSIFQSFDRVAIDESATVITWITVTHVILLDFSVYVAATVIKKLACGQIPTQRTYLSYIVIVLCLALFSTLFIMTFRFKFELRDTLFSMDNSGSIDNLVNKAVQAGSNAINTFTPATINEEDVVRTAAFITGSCPAFTSVLSFVSVVLFYDPNANNVAKLKAKRLLYRYRVYCTDQTLAALKRDIAILETLPKQYADAVRAEQRRYDRFVEGLYKSEYIAKVAHYTAATELFKDDQDIVTQLSITAKTMPVRRAGSIFDETAVQHETLLPALAEQIKNVENLFATQMERSDVNEPPNCSSPDKVEDKPKDSSDDVLEIPDYQPETMTDYTPDVEFDVTSEPIEETTSVHSVPNAFVAPWLQTAIR